MTRRQPKAQRCSGDSKKGRFSARRKVEAVRRLIAGEELNVLARELGVTAATLSNWREKFLKAGEAGLKSCPTDDRDDEILRLKVMVGELTTGSFIVLPFWKHFQIIGLAQIKPGFHLMQF